MSAVMSWKNDEMPARRATQWIALMAFLLSFTLSQNLLLAGRDSLPPPNIILMMADDMGMGDTSAYQDITGNSDSDQIHTPNMERPAELGIRFTDAHSPASRCSTTRYSLLTGRYSWRTRLKWWVLFGAQGDPLIEPDRPTIATLLKGKGYRTGIVGKWHLGLRYRRSDNKPASGWIDADLSQALHTSPLDHGFDQAFFTSRSHGTSGPNLLTKNPNKANGPKQAVGPGHIQGRRVVGASGHGRKLVSSGPNAYVLSELGSRHSDHALEFLNNHASGAEYADRPFFLYYPSNSNHGPYTPDKAINGRLVAKSARTKSGDPMDSRHDYIYENDVALGRLLDWLENTLDPRRSGQRMIENTLVIFTSDNGAEKDSRIATGPFRSNKGSCYEGGHRVPFLAAWPVGGIRKESSIASPIGLQDLYATFSEIINTPLPNLLLGAKGGEDSHSILPELKGVARQQNRPLFFCDHKESVKDPAVLAMRLDHPTVEDTPYPGQWKIFFRAPLNRFGRAKPFELYDLATDSEEKKNRINDLKLPALIQHLATIAHEHRNLGGHRFVSLSKGRTTTFDWGSSSPNNGQLIRQLAGKPHSILTQEVNDLTMVLKAVDAHTSLPVSLHLAADGFAVNRPLRDSPRKAEALLITFDQPVIIESVGLFAGAGQCGGFYQMADDSPQAIYCLDADNDAKEQHGAISDLGILKAGEVLRLDSRPHLGVEAHGQWSLSRLSVRRANLD